MALVTGTPLGSITSSEDIYPEGAAYIYFQDYNANPLNNPDGDTYYWGLSGTSTYPVYNVGCPVNVSLSEDLTINDVRCDNIGTKDTVQRRNYMELTLEIQSIFPLTVLRHTMKASAPTVSTDISKVGFGPINNNQYYMVYMPKVYDEDNGDYVVFHMHKAKFVDAWTLNMRQGEPWGLTGVRLRAFADDTKPSGQQFMTVIRSDASVL